MCNSVKRTLMHTTLATGIPIAYLVGEYFTSVPQQRTKKMHVCTSNTLSEALVLNNRSNLARI